MCICLQLHAKQRFQILAHMKYFHQFTNLTVVKSGTFSTIDKIIPVSIALTNLSDDTGTRNNSVIKNESRYDNMDFIQLIDIELFEKYYHNRAVSSATYWSLIVAYSLLIVAGSIGNLLVILAVVNNKSKCQLFFYYLLSFNFFIT
jgi:hypothetical protein